MRQSTGFGSVLLCTLLLSPADAERAVLATLQGSIHFVLRNGSDKETPAAHSLDLAQLVGGNDKPTTVRTVHESSSAPFKALQVPVELAVQTIAGEKLTTDTFRVGQQ